MTALKDKMENSLNEGRILILVSQVIIGFDLQLAFKRAFTELPHELQWLQLGGLFVMVLAFGALLLLPAFHRISESGKVTQRLLSMSRNVSKLALFAFALATGIAVCLSAWKVLTPKPSLLSGALTMVMCLGAWYLHPRSSEDNTAQSKQEGDQEMELKDRVKEVLIETRMVLPGAQAMLGFQFIAIFSEGFAPLPQPMKLVHFAALLSVTVAITALVAPAAFHRIAKQGEDSEEIVTFASRAVLVALAFLGLGISLDILPLVYIVAESYKLAVTAGALCLVALYATWFGYTKWRKQKAGNSPAMIKLAA